MRHSGRRLARRPAGQDYRNCSGRTVRRGENAACTPRVPNGCALGGVAQATWPKWPGDAVLACPISHVNSEED
jgi:hypothetical protein